MTFNAEQRQALIAAIVAAIESGDDVSMKVELGAFGHYDCVSGDGEVDFFGRTRPATITIEFNGGVRRADDAESPAESHCIRCRKRTPPSCGMAWCADCTAAYKAAQERWMPRKPSRPRWPWTIHA
jgi:hypothetical protein